MPPAFRGPGFPPRGQHADTAKCRLLCHIGGHFSNLSAYRTHCRLDKDGYTRSDQRLSVFCMGSSAQLHTLCVLRAGM